MRFTALAVPKMITVPQITQPTAPSSQPGQVVAGERERRVDPAPVHLRDAEGHGDRDEAERLPSLVETERAPPAHLDPVVGGPDGAGGHDGGQHEQRRTG